MSNTREHISHRLRTFRRKMQLGQEEMAAQMDGISRSVLANVESGRQWPSRNLVEGLCETFAMNASWLLFEDGPMRRPDVVALEEWQRRHLLPEDRLSDHPEDPRPDEPDSVEDHVTAHWPRFEEERDGAVEVPKQRGTSEDVQKVRVVVAGQEHFVNPAEYRFVPVLNVRLSGGVGIANLFENIHAFNAYRKSWLADWGLIDAVLSEAGVTGRSMEPELRDGDSVLVNHSAEFVSGDIYALRQGEDLLVKYLQKLPGDRIQVISENADAFPPYVISPADFESGECEIIGRVELQTRHRGRRMLANTGLTP